MRSAESGIQGPSRPRLHWLADDRSELGVSGDLGERDLHVDDEAEKQNDREILGRQGHLRLDPAPEVLVQALDDVGGPERLPMGPGEAEEREHLLAAILESLDDARAALGPLELEGAGPPR